MNYRSKRCIAVLSACPVLLLGTTGCLNQPPTPNTIQNSANLSDVLEAYGYTELEPPSTLTPPGTIVMVQSANPLELGVVCEEASALAASAPVQNSNGASSNVVNSTTGTFDLGLNVVNRVNAQIGMDAVKSISVSLNNVQEIEIPDDTVVQFAAQRTQPCKTAIDLRQQEGDKLTMIKSVLKADATYNITYVSNFNTSIQAQILPTIAANLNASIGVNNSGSLTGTGLYWGVRDNSVLVNWPNPPTNPAPTTRVGANALASHGLSQLHEITAPSRNLYSDLSTRPVEPHEAPSRPVLQPGAVVSQIQVIGH